MEDALMEATGINGRVLLFRDVVRIKWMGIGSVLSGASKIEKDIVISQIRGVEFKLAGLLNNGYIEFVTMHGRDGRDDSDHGWQTTVTFRPGQQKAFVAFRDMLESRLSDGATGRAPSAAGTDLDELEKLASLRDRAIITEDEFSRKKRRLLGL